MSCQPASSVHLNYTLPAFDKNLTQKIRFSNATEVLQSASCTYVSVIQFWPGESTTSLVHIVNVFLLSLPVGSLYYFCDLTTLCMLFLHIIMSNGLVICLKVKPAGILVGCSTVVVDL